MDCGSWHFMSQYIFNSLVTEDSGWFYMTTFSQVAPFRHSSMCWITTKETHINGHSVIEIIYLPDLIYLSTWAGYVWTPVQDSSRATLNGLFKSLFVLLPNGTISWHYIWEGLCFISSSWLSLQHFPLKRSDGNWKTSSWVPQKLLPVHFIINLVSFLISTLQFGGKSSIALCALCSTKKTLQLEILSLLFQIVYF